jgi:hypothetical protein
MQLLQGLRSTMFVLSTSVWNVVQAVGEMMQQYEATGALVSSDAPSMAPCASSLHLQQERIKLVCDRAREALGMQGEGRKEALLEAEKHLAAILHVRHSF